MEGERLRQSRAQPGGEPIYQKLLTASGLTPETNSAISSVIKEELRNDSVQHLETIEFSIGKEISREPMEPHPMA